MPQYKNYKGVTKKMTVNRDYILEQHKLDKMGLTSMKPEYITIHGTGNSASALNEAKNVYNNNWKLGDKGAAFHLAVDEKETYQILEFNIHGWHAGDGGKGNGNRKSIGIEIARELDRETDNYEKAVVRAAAEAKKLMKEFGIPLEKVVQHNHWSKKDCPKRLRAGDKTTWEQFLGLLQDEKKPEANTPAKPKNPYTEGKSTLELAHEVLNLVHKTGAERKRRLGDRYAEVQDLVNKMVAGEKPKPAPVKKEKTISELAQEVIDGKHKDGDERKKSLGNRYREVQNEVNRILGGGSKPKTPDVGNRVKLKYSATHYATGELIPASRKNKWYTVLQKAEGKILLKELYSWVYTKDIEQ